jgi:hypothetical protein
MTENIEGKGEGKMGKYTCHLMRGAQKDEEKFEGEMSTGEVKCV